MSIKLNDNIEVLAPKPSDPRFGPWASVNAAIIAVPLAVRHLGLLVGIVIGGNVIQHIFKSGTGDSDLLPTTVDLSNYYTKAEIDAISSLKADLVSGKVPLSQLPDAIQHGFQRKGSFNATTNLITSSDSTLNGLPLPTAAAGNEGYLFIVTGSGTYNSLDFNPGDYIVSLGSAGWGKIDNTERISTTDDVTEGTTNLYYTTTRAKAAIFQTGNFTNSIAGGIKTTVTAGASVLLETVFDTQLDDNLDLNGALIGKKISDYKGGSLVKMFEDAFAPTVAPTYTPVTLGMSIAGSNSTLQVGAPYSTGFTVTGVKNDAGSYSVLEVVKNGATVLTMSSISTTSATAIANQFGYTNPNNPNYSYSATTGDTGTVPLGTISWQCRGTYGAGLAKKNNKNSTDTRTALIRNSNTPQAAEVNFTSTSASLTGIYPYFYGVSNSLPTAASIASSIAAGSASLVLSSADGNITVPFNTSGAQYLWFALTGTSKARWFVDALNNGAIGGTSNLFGTEIIQAVNSPSGYWSAINFKVYISNYATTASSMQLQN